MGRSGSRQKLPSARSGGIRTMGNVSAKQGRSVSSNDLQYL